VILKRFYEESLAHASYLVGCPGAGEAVIVDPNRNIEQYLAAAEAEGLRITRIAETHIHADYVSGARELSDVTGATMILSGEGGSEWQYAFPDMSRAVLVKDGDSFRFGALRFDVIHTPGHTPEHISFLLTDESAGQVPVALFTGDFVFVGDVGRPDLLEQAAGLIGTMEPGARALFESIQTLKHLPDHLLIWPAHGAGSACGKSLGGSPVTTLGYEKATNWAFQIMEEDEFVKQVLAGQPDPPPYFAAMKRVNKVGPSFLHQRHVRRLAPGETDGLLQLDVRPTEQFLAGHPIGALHIPVGRAFLRWAGWLLRETDQVVLIAGDEALAADAAKALSLIGIDDVHGWAAPDMFEQVFIESADISEVDDLQLVDVRSRSEWDEGHVSGAISMPLQSLRQVQIDSLPDHFAVYCGTGFRSAVAASILQAAGYEPVVIRNTYEEVALHERPRTLVTT
jgi:hydroxyacylglutathione hydrolase